jgi:hypothetical protein
MVMVKETNFTSKRVLLNNRFSCSLFPVIILVSLRRQTAFLQIHSQALTNKFYRF